ncbi:hypothetical protein XENOCAPTIV_018088 [Xenoophorus captivus]|uniref:Uncharacterized protein n=1 Tax=Xenoophorus captivus TaxID=1517983 RepID=A0ABV0RWY4_9TELE
MDLICYHWNTKILSLFHEGHSTTSSLKVRAEQTKAMQEGLPSTEQRDRLRLREGGTQRSPQISVEGTGCPSDNLKVLSYWSIYRKEEDPCAVRGCVPVQGLDPFKSVLVG